MRGNQSTCNEHALRVLAGIYHGNHKKTGHADAQEQGEMRGH